MPEDKKGEITVTWSDGVTEKANEDPKVAEFLRDFGACVRQAMQAVENGQYDCFEDAIEALTGHRPERIEEDDDDDDWVDFAPDEAE